MGFSDLQFLAFLESSVVHWGPPLAGVPDDQGLARQSEHIDKSHPRAARPVDILHGCVYLGCKLRAHHPRLYKVTCDIPDLQFLAFLESSVVHWGPPLAGVPDDQGLARQSIVRRSGAVDLAAICSVYISMGFSGFEFLTARL
jgi:hypothetical protein